MAPRPIHFRWIFPFGQLSLCWFMTAVVYFLPPMRWLYLNSVVQIIRCLNLPGGLLQLPITILRADKTDWHPPGVESSLWCAISWPVLALVFWWMAGRAVEALRTLGGGQIMPRVTLAEAIVGGVLMSFGLVLVVGLTISEGRQVYTNRSTGLLAATSGLWAFLGGLSVIARFRQWRLRLTRNKPIS